MFRVNGALSFLRVYWTWKVRTFNSNVTSQTSSSLNFVTNYMGEYKNRRKRRKRNFFKSDCDDYCISIKTSVDLVHLASVLIAQITTWIGNYWCIEMTMPRDTPSIRRHKINLLEMMRFNGTIFFFAPLSLSLYNCVVIDVCVWFVFFFWVFGALIIVYVCTNCYLSLAVIRLL